MYTPPKSYWKELTKLDDRLVAIKGDGEPIAWKSEDQEALSVWRRSKSFPRTTNRLIVGNTVNIDPLSEGLDSGCSEVKSGFIGKDFNYSVGRILLPNLVLVDHIQLTDIDDPSLPEKDFGNFKMDLKSGMLFPDEDDYDLLITELQRGASGDHAVELS